jgi:uncharacterized protein YlxP (DUF503 family)
VARTTGRAHAATLEVDLRLPHATSLKDKRALLRAVPGHVTEVLDVVERFVWSFPEVEVVSTERDWVG